jgi:membrane protein YqaA with SNARE-associated domain
MDVIKKFLGLSFEKKMIVFTVVLLILLTVGVLFNREFFVGLVGAYGLPGLFLASLVGSTIFIFFSVEGLFPFLMTSGIEPLHVIGVATIGSLIGTWINYGLGFIGSGFIEEKFDHGGIEKAHGFMDKYGWAGLFVVIAMPLPLPIPVDPITVIPGVARMNFLEFTAVVIAGKLVKYGFWAGVLSIFTLTPNIL